MDDKIYASAPIDKKAAVVTGKGIDYIPDIKIFDSELPLPVCRNIPKWIVNLTGKKFGKLTVIGLAVIEEKKLNGSKWVVRCVCGRYSMRKARAINNENNKLDCCKECEKLMSLKRSEYYRKYGKNDKEKEYFF